MVKSLLLTIYAFHEGVFIIEDAGKSIEDYLELITYSDSSCSMEGIIRKKLHYDKRAENFIMSKIATCDMCNIKHGQRTYESN